MDFKRSGSDSSLDEDFRNEGLSDDELIAAMDVAIGFENDYDEAWFVTEDTSSFLPIHDYRTQVSLGRIQWYVG